jgi:hypothetical protein
VSGIKEALAMQSIGLGMFKAKRINPMEIFGGHGVKDLKGFHAIIAKAKEIEDRKKGFTRLRTETKNGKERIRVLPRLLLAAQGLGIELPGVDPLDVRRSSTSS